jgi:hypothetical protein
MPRKSRAQQLQAAKAREGRARRQLGTDSDPDKPAEESNLDVEVTSWTGSVNNHLTSSDDSGSDFIDTEWESESSENEVNELEGVALVESLQKEIENERNLLKQAADLETPYEKINNANLTTKDWKKAEEHQGLGYNGLASRTQRKHQQEAREKAEKDKITRKL